MYFCSLFAIFFHEWKKYKYVVKYNPFLKIVHYFLKIGVQRLGLKLTIYEYIISKDFITPIKI